MRGVGSLKPAKYLFRARYVAVSSRENLDNFPLITNETLVLDDVRFS